MRAPRFSVVMYLPDSRGIAGQSVRSWTEQRDFARDRFELLVMANGSEPETEAQIPPLLSGNDRLLCYCGAARTELFDRGVRAARGEFVILTESHSPAEPDFLDKMDQFLQSSSLDAACCNALPMCSGALSRLDAKCFEEGFQQYRRPEDWRKVNIHGFALRRSVYLKIGGLNPRYGTFAEMVLAAELWRCGYRPGFAEAPTVRHKFAASVRVANEFHRDAVAGEIRYHRDHPRGPRIEHTYLADGDSPWSDRELTWAAFTALWSERQRGGGQLLRHGWHAFKLGVREGRPGRAADLAAMVLSLAGCWLCGSRSARSKRLYLRFWASAARLARKRFLATEADRIPVEARVPVPVSYRIDDLLERDVLGFHLLEHWQGEPMRWTGRCAVVRLPRPECACQLILQTRGVGWPATERAPSFYIDGRRLPASAVSIEQDRIRLWVDGSAERCPLLLAVVCDPVKPESRGTDRRELGLPLFGIETVPLHAAPLRVAA